ncbi:MAG: class I SAM-dependent methyltransferase [Candidatus Sericytochromatia bacterium]|nr:class I SAM-dependent methyltransferase [Candidatus Sericytochromatia bacterium]
MSNRTLSLTPALRDYLLAHGAPEPEVLGALRRETARMAGANMQIAPEQGAFMTIFSKLIGARRCLEVGTFTGYSAIAVALALPQDGRLHACDIDEAALSVARRYAGLAGVHDKLVFHPGDATATLDRLLEEGGRESFDMMFIDADKTGYAGYWDRGLELLRPGGVVLADNVLWSGHVIDEAVQDEDTRALRAFNEKVRSDDRVEVVMLPLADGLTLARKL